jgi:hypothetical protein
MGTMRRRILLQGLFLLGVTVLAPPLWAEPEIKVSLTPTSRVKQGNTVELFVDLVWRSQEADYLFTRPEPILERLVMEEIGESSEAFHKEGEEWKRKTFRFVLNAALPGRGEVRGFRVNYVDSAKQLGGHFDVEPWEINVTPDRSKLYRNLGLGFGVLALGGGLAGLFFWLRSQRAKKLQRVPEPGLEERYASRLNEIKVKLGDRQSLFEAGRVFRQYLSEKYSISQTFQTTEELLGQLQSQLRSDEGKSLKRIFERLDEWRYASSEGALKQQEALFTEIIRYVEGKRVVDIS